MGQRDGSPGPDRGSDAESAFTAIAGELYAVALPEFTAIRTGYEKRLRQSGERELAARVHGLAKPTVTAWLANQLVRTDSSGLRELPALGAELRRATERRSGDELRRLSRRQHELVSELVGHARELASNAGQAVSEETARGLEDTFYAALADEELAGLLLAGRLTAPLQRPGFGDWSVAPTERAGRAVAPSPGRRRADADAQLRHADGEVAEARRRLAGATEVLGRARAVAAVSAQALQDLSQEEERLRQALQDASSAVSEAERRHRQVSAQLRRAERAVEEAERLQAQARLHRDALADAE